MLDSIEPRQMDEWLAYRELEPDPLERLIKILKIGVALICEGLGIEVTPDELEPEGEGGGGQEMTPAQGAQMMTRYYGPPERRGFRV